MTDNYQKRFHTIHEVMDITSLGRTSVYNAINQGKLEAKKFGSKTLIPVESLEAFIANLSSKHEVEGN